MTNPKPCLLKCLCMCGNSRAGHVREMHRPNDFCPRQDGHAPGCPNAAPKASDAPKRCPECKHRPHGTVCFNGESDGDCGCEYGKPAPAPEAPKVEEYLRTGDGPDTLYPAKPAPPPEPRGKEEYPTIQSAVDEWVEYWKRSEDQPQDIELMCPWGSVARAYLALRAEVERLKKDRTTSAVGRLHNLCDGFEEMDKRTEEEIAKLRAELAAADQNLKTMLQAAGEEAERQLAAAREEIAKLRSNLDDIEKLKVKRFAERHNPPCNNYDCDRCYR